MSTPETIDAATQLEHLTMAVELSRVAVPDVLLPEDGFLAVGGVRLHYLDWGDPGGRPILFLHGARLSAHTWDVVCLALRNRYRCIALDARGHGDSDWADLEGYTAENHVGDVEGVVEQLGLDQFVLVGHSMGGGTALAYAGRHAAKLKALVIVDTGPAERPGVMRPGVQRMHDFVNGPAEFETLEEVVERALAFNPARDRRLLRRSLLNNMRRLPNGHWAWKYHREGLGRRSPDQMEARRQMLLDAVPRISCPTLVLRGGISDMFTDEDAARLAAQLPDGRWHMVPNAGHTIQGDNPKGLLEALEPFLTEVGA
ncbi:MAG TPA: alpha/beta hydrolase [Chloroflexota bacterium]|nr:alpha/beta hydrolase [Chloroflexota bacterium]